LPDFLVAIDLRTLHGSLSLQFEMNSPAASSGEYDPKRFNCSNNEKLSWRYSRSVGNEEVDPNLECLHFISVRPLGLARKKSLVAERARNLPRSLVAHRRTQAPLRHRFQTGDALFHRGVGAEQIRDPAGAQRIDDEHMRRRVGGGIAYL